MFRYEKQRFAACVLCLIICHVLCLTAIVLAQNEVTDEKIIERYKLMLNRKPKEGSTFDRLYQFYLEGDGLDAMVSDYQAEAQAKPNDANVQLILGHIHKRLGKGYRCSCSVSARCRACTEQLLCPFRTWTNIWDFTPTRRCYPSINKSRRPCQNKHKMCPPKS